MTVQEHSCVLSKSARMTLLCVLLQELLGCPKMKIQNKLGRQKKKKPVFILIHSEPLSVGKLSIAFCYSFLERLRFGRVEYINTEELVLGFCFFFKPPLSLKNTR